MKRMLPLLAFLAFIEPIPNDPVTVTMKDGRSLTMYANLCEDVAQQHFAICCYRGDWEGNEMSLGCFRIREMKSIIIDGEKIKLPRPAEFP